MEWGGAEGPGRRVLKGEKDVAKKKRKLLPYEIAAARGMKLVKERKAQTARANAAAANRRAFLKARTAATNAARAARAAQAEANRLLKAARAASKKKGAGIKLKEMHKKIK